MMNRLFRAGIVAGVLAGACGWSWAQAGGSGSGAELESRAGKRPMTFADLMRMKRVSDPQISPGGRWVMFSVVDVDLEKNSKVSHLWVVPLGGGREADFSAALRNGNDKQKGVGDGGGEPMFQGRDMGHPVSGAEKQVTFWKEGESGGRFSPDGEQILFTATDAETGLSQIFLAPWDESTGTLGTPQRLTHISTEADGAVWSPDSTKILFASRVYPECSNESVWLDEENCNKRRDAAAAASPVKAQVFDHLLYRHWDHYVGEKRSHVMVVSAADGNAIRDLTPRRVVGDAEVPTFSLGGPMGYAWAPDSKEIAFVTNVDPVPAASTNNDIFTLRLDDATAGPVKISASLGSDDAPAYSPDGRYIAFRSQARAGYESDRFRLMLFDRQTGTAKELLPKFDRWVDEFVWGPESDAPGEIFFTAGDKGEENLYAVHAGHSAKEMSAAERRQMQEMNKLLEALDPARSSSDGNLVGQWTEGSEISSPVLGSLAPLQNGRRVNGNLAIVALSMKVDQPAEILQIHPSDFSVPSAPDTLGVVHNEKNLQSTRLTHVNDALLHTLAMPKMESYWFTGAENAKVQGFIIRPPGFDEHRKYPVKFLIHGGPQGAWGDAWSYRWNPELMAASGYVVVMVNPRGSTGYGQAFVDGVNGDWGGKAYGDLMKGLDYAEQHYGFIDKTRECALGASYGGYMADWILTHTNRFACIVTHDGMFNPESAYGATEELWFNEWEFRRPGDTQPGQPWRYAAGPVANDPFRKWSPMLSIQNAKTPTLVIHSQRDYRLDVSEGMQLFTALQRMNVPSRMLYFPDEGHWVLKPQNAKLWNETVSEWCDEWTKTNGYSAGPQYVASGVSAPPEEPIETTKAPEVPKAAAKGAVRPQIAPVVPAPVAPVATAPVAPVPTPAPVASNRAAVSVAPAAAPSPPAAPSRVVSSAAGSAGGAFSIAISAPRDEVSVHGDAQVVIVLKNLSDRQILFAHHPGRENPEFSYRIEVKNAAGRPAEATAYGRGASQTGGSTVDYVQPGGTTMQTAHLAKLFSLRPGRYTVVVSRKDGGTVVRSNEIVLNVVPGVR